MSNPLDKAKEAAASLKDKMTGGSKPGPGGDRKKEEMIDKAAEGADKATGGKFEDKIDKAADTAKDKLT